MYRPRATAFSIFQLSTQGDARMLATPGRRAMRERLKLNLIRSPSAPEDVNGLGAACERAGTPRTKRSLGSRRINPTGQINAVKWVGEMGRAHGIETSVD